MPKKKKSPGCLTQTIALALVTFVAVKCYPACSKTKVEPIEHFSVASAKSCKRYGGPKQLIDLLKSSIKLKVGQEFGQSCQTTNTICIQSDGTITQTDYVYHASFVDKLNCEAVGGTWHAY
jgi:hypothetical protein